VSVGLLALLDDIVGLTKIAAASLDDAAGQAARAVAKAAGVVIDDAAVTPRYVVGFAAERELPIVGKIAVGSLKNKLLYLLPAALVLSLTAPWMITPLLMLGGAYLCYEGSEKVLELLWPHGAHAHETAVRAAGPDPQGLEQERGRGAIKTDFILSAEIMAITLGTVPTAPLWTQAVVLAVVGMGITALVYGGVALIVKADDAGVALASNDTPVSGLLTAGQHRSVTPSPSRADRLVRVLTRSFGRALVRGMPVFLKSLGIVGTAAMVWVGGGIIIHGFEGYGMAEIGHAVHAAAEAAARWTPAMSGAAAWTVTATASGIFGLLVGVALIPLAQFVALPALKLLRAAGIGRNQSRSG